MDIVIISIPHTEIPNTLINTHVLNTAVAKCDMFPTEYILTVCSLMTVVSIFI